SPQEMDLCIRLYYAKVLIPSPDLAKCLDDLATNSAAVRQLVISWWSLMAARCFEDLEGACEENDRDLASIIGRSMLTGVGKAVAAAAGDLYLNQKWVYKQLSRSVNGWFPLGKFRWM